MRTLKIQKMMKIGTQVPHLLIQTQRRKKETDCAGFQIP